MVPVPAVRRPKASEMKPYAPHLISLLRLLPRLKVLVTCGAVPRDFWRKQVRLPSPHDRRPPIHPSIHPSSPPSLPPAMERTTRPSVRRGDDVCPLFGAHASRPSIAAHPCGLAVILVRSPPWPGQIWADPDMQRLVRAAVAGPLTVIHARHPSAQSMNQIQGARGALLSCHQRAAQLVSAPRPVQWEHHDRSRNVHIGMGF